MSEEALRRVLDRLNEDEAFRTRMKDDWQDAIDELGLSPAELAALATQDEDALRRLAGADVSGFALAAGPAQGSNLFGTAIHRAPSSVREGTVPAGGGPGDPSAPYNRRLQGWLGPQVPSLPRSCAVAGTLGEALQALDYPATAGPLTRRDVTSGGSRAAIEPLFRYDLPIEEDPIRSVLERRVPWVVHDETFSQQSFGTGPWPDQGWKLHVSATPLSAVDVLERALDVLLAEGVRFKVVTTVGVLGSMNFGLFGVSQIGKFITVYPSDDAQAVRLAVALDAATARRRGPRVPTDRPLGPGSLVHYRYGSMVRRSHGGGHEEQSRNDLLDPAGRLIDDVRVGFYSPPPPEIVDPFEAAGVRVHRPDVGDSSTAGTWSAMPSARARVEPSSALSTSWPSPRACAS